MIYRFEDYALDTGKMELSRAGAAVAIEPQVFALLTFLVEHRDRMVTRDEIIDAIWDGRIVSDAAVASRVKSARQAVGDDGKAQKFIRTIHGVGLRFVAEVTLESPLIEVTRELAPAPHELKPHATQSSRPSIAVLPFRLVGVAGPAAGIADALPDDLITELSRLRWLFVIARGSTFQLRGAEAHAENVRLALHARYCLSGAVEVLGDRMTVAVELSDTRDNGVVWGDRYRGAIGDVHDIREQIAREVTNALELRIPLNEARLARLKSPEHLDAWSAYHLGLHHMYRFNKDDNARATALFTRASELEPSFSRAYAGLSFTRFQDAFLRYTSDDNAAREDARRHAERALECDPMDPFGNFTMGRAVMINGDLEGSFEWLERANTLSPNYAQAKYSRAWVDALVGDLRESRADVDEAMALSPLDPFRYAMLGVRAFSHIASGEWVEAARWGEQAARAPNAHVLVQLIAAVAHDLNGDPARAKARVDGVLARTPGISSDDFLSSFPFRDEATRKIYSNSLRRLGLP